MRRRLIAYCTMLFLNLAIVSGSLTATEVEPVPIVRLHRHDGGTSRFSSGELTNEGSVVVRSLRARRSAFHAN